MKYKFKKILYYIFSISILAIAYANCAQQPLEKVETPVQTFEVHPKVLKSSLCSESRPVASPGSKFVFIVDMSASNFGDWRIESITSQEGQVQKLYFWDPSKASDSASDRLTAIEYFIDNCGGSTNDRYAIVAFSKTAGIAKTIKTSTQLSCEAPRFVSAAELKIQISKLKEVQNMDRLWYERWINTYKTEVTPDSLVMAGTSYPQALNCTLD
ncbi:MAG TPA: hypothetical protein PLJ21_13050, partial [Pseudobdellovibrionaceae bacterium]|nr:hypothetical protein [Pseudobdellovibrionaceae bacterium]